MLNGPFELHNIRDVEGFTDRIINRRRLHWLQPHEREDLHAYLIETAWELSLRFEPNGWPFSKWAGPTLNSRVTDWLRREFFDGRYVEGPVEFTEYVDDGTVGEADVDPGERGVADVDGTDAEGTIPAAAYFPSGDFLASRGIRRPQARETDREQVGAEAA